MAERMWGVSRESPRIGGRTPGAARAPRAVVLGEPAQTEAIGTRLSEIRTAEVRLSRAIADVVILWNPDLTAVREVSLWAVRSCPRTALILASHDGLALCREAARASGLARHLVLSTGGIAHAAREARLIAARLDVSLSQVCAPVIGGDAPAGTWPLRRYAAVAGIPAEAMGDSGPWGRPERTAVVPRSDESLIAAAVTLARAVLEDRREILSCGAWVEGTWGIPGGWVIAPVPVGARGAEAPLPMRLRLDERAHLQRAAIVP